MLRLKPFELAMPESVEEARALLADRDGAIVMAGGTDVVPKMKRGQFDAPLVVSLANVQGLDFVEVIDGELTIGARTTLRTLERSPQVAEYPCLHDAVRQIATPIIRNSATIGGNLLQDTRCRYYDRSPFWRDAIGYCLKKNGDTCQVAPGGSRCYATLCSDLAPVLIVLGASIKVVGDGERRLSLEELYRDDGIVNITLNREIMTEIAIPAGAWPATYKKLRMREGFDFPEVGVAVAVKEVHDDVEVRIAVTGVGSQIFVFTHKVAKNRLSDVAGTVFDAVKPLDTMFFPPSYRKTMVKRFILQAFDELVAS